MGLARLCATPGAPREGLPVEMVRLRDRTPPMKVSANFTKVYPLKQPNLKPPSPDGLFSAL